MKLNSKCVRSVLLQLEKQALGILTYIDDFPPQESFSKEEIVYSCLKLAEAGFVHAEISKDLLGDYSGYITDITYDGQKFLNKIKNDEVWNKISPLIEQLGCSSFDLIEKIADEILWKQASASL